MPYFKWEGIDIAGVVHRGKKRTVSYEMLDKNLMRENIALLRAYPIKEWSINPLSRRQITWFLKQLAALLKAGIFLDQALVLIKKQIKHKKFKTIMHDLEAYIMAGGSLSLALCAYSDIFDPVTIQLLQIGQESGSLQQACELLVNISSMSNDFSHKIRKALLMPVLTLLFFCVILFFISVWIVPLLLDMLLSAKQQIPQSIYFLLAIHALLHSVWMPGILILFLSILLIVKQNMWIKNNIDSLLVKTPVVGHLIRYYALMQLLNSLGLLMRGRVPIHRALFIMSNAIKNKAILLRYLDIKKMIDEGSALSYALQQSNLFFQEIVAIVAMGEESGRVGDSLLQAAEMYKERINYILFLITTIMQPLLLIFLGLLVLFLIKALYMPIIDISYHIA